MVLKRDVGSPQSIVANALAVLLPDVAIWLYVYLVAVEGIRNGPNVVWMADCESSLRVPRWHWWRTSDGFSHRVCFALNVEAVFVGN